MCHLLGSGLGWLWESSTSYGWEWPAQFRGFVPPTRKPKLGKKGTGVCEQAGFIMQEATVLLWQRKDLFGLVLALKDTGTGSLAGCSDQLSVFH